MVVIQPEVATEPEEREFRFGHSFSRGHPGLEAMNAKEVVNVLLGKQLFCLFLNFPNSVV